MEKSGFFNAMKVGDKWDKAYKAEDFAGYFASFIANGVFPNPAVGLQVTETDKMQVIVQLGKGWINGFIYENTDNLVLNVDVADGVLNRIDRVVLRYDVAEREIRAKIKKGEYKSEPIAPTIQRDADIYELALADIKINAGAIKISQADITDLRFNKQLCGLVHTTVEQIDSTVIFNQFQSWYSTTQTNYDKDINSWIKNKKETFDSWYKENTEQWGNEFIEWFDTLKNKLDDNMAVKLQMEIDNLKFYVDNGKSNLYSAIVDKKITPRSKEFKDLTNAIDNIKLGQGNAQANEVLQGKTFTNDTGIEQTGAMINNGTVEKVITTQGGQYNLSGFYSGGFVKTNILNLEKQNIAHGVNVGGCVGTFYPYMPSKKEDFNTSGDIVINISATTKVDGIKQIDTAIFQLLVTGSVGVWSKEFSDPPDNQFVKIYRNDTLVVEKRNIDMFYGGYDLSCGCGDIIKLETITLNTANLRPGYYSPGYRVGIKFISYDAFLKIK